MLHSSEKLDSSHEIKVKDIVWDEAKQICIQNAAREVEIRGCDTECLSLLRGAYLSVSVYVRRVWQLQMASDCTSGSPSHECVLSSNALHIGDELIGGTAVDLSTLAVGMREVSGWYHLVDSKHHASGQIFFTAALPFIDVKVVPLGVSKLLTLPILKESEGIYDDDDADSYGGDDDDNVAESDIERQDGPQLMQEGRKCRGQIEATGRSRERMDVNVDVEEERNEVRNDQPVMMEVVQTNAGMYVRMYLCICVCMYVCMYVFWFLILFLCMFHLLDLSLI